MKLGKPIKYIAVPPKEVIERVKGRVQEDALHRDKTLDSLKASSIIDDLNGMFKKGTDHIEPSDMMGVVRGRSNITSHVQSMIKNAKESVALALPSVSNESTEHMQKSIMKAHKNNIPTRVITQDKTNLVWKTASVKNNGQLNFRLLIVDTHEILFMPVEENDPQNEFGVWIKHKPFVKNFENIFDTVWNKSA